MKPPDPVEELFARVLRAGEQAPALRAALEESGADPVTLVGVLRRPVPVHLLELVAATPPWSSDARLLAAVVLNPRAPRALALRLLSGLFWRDLADVAVSPRVDGSVRVRAEALLVEQLPDLRLGERVTLARLATPPVLRLLLADAEEKVTEACLRNPRLREEDLLLAVRQPRPSRALLETIPASPRWCEAYAVRLALVLQPRTPLGVALAQLTALRAQDLVRIGDTEGLPPLVKAVALELSRSRTS